MSSLSLTNLTCFVIVKGKKPKYQDFRT